MPSSPHRGLFPRFLVFGKVFGGQYREKFLGLGTAGQNHISPQISGGSGRFQ
jgi:hypothetical protein